jgi:hypothetical protein
MIKALQMQQRFKLGFDLLGIGGQGLLHTVLPRN